MTTTVLSIMTSDAAIDDNCVIHHIHFHLVKQQKTWVALSYDEWYNSIGLTEEQVRNACERLQGVVYHDIRLHNGRPVPHYRLDYKSLAIWRMQGVL